MGDGAKALVARCACGNVVIEAAGAPIATVVCYCDDCQEAARRLSVLPHLGPMAEKDGGTPYALFRKDRIRYAIGAAFLERHKLTEGSRTNRAIASCCNFPMLLEFEDSRHWVTFYRGAFRDGAPPLQWRIATRFKPPDAELPKDVPAYRSFPLGLVSRLVSARVAMMLGR
ncbi:MAG TPA: hypothetical protein VGD74_01460 [Vulgatibacter sp.]